MKCLKIEIKDFILKSVIFKHLAMKVFKQNTARIFLKVVNEFPFKLSLCDGKHTHEAPLQRLSSPVSLCRDPKKWKLSMVVDRTWIRTWICHLVQYSFYNGLIAKSCLTLVTPMDPMWPCQAPLSMGFSRQEYWSGLLFPSPFFFFIILVYITFFVNFF